MVSKCILPLKYPSTITLNVTSMIPKIIMIGTIGSLGSVIEEVFIFSKSVSFDVFVSVIFALEVTDFGVASIGIF